MTPDNINVRMVDMQRTSFTKGARYIQNRAAQGYTTREIQSPTLS